MKFYESHFEEYINKPVNLHPKLSKIYSKFPERIRDLKNLIFYGPAGVGKYTQALQSIRKYSACDLKYEKKLNMIYNKNPIYFKISDIHYEIDMALLGCVSKLLWHDIYMQIVDVLSAKPEKTGIIVCKNFHEIHGELLENFYSYMQRHPYVNIKYILISEEICFIPDSIINCCETIHIPRPTKTQYNSCLTPSRKLSKTFNVSTIINIKNLHEPVDMFSHVFICNKIIEFILNQKSHTFLKARELLYDIFVYNLNMSDCVWYILLNLISAGHIARKDISNILIKTYEFYQYYNNNYRPIYHIEKYIYYIISVIII
jgi:hypothetical protein